MTKPRVPFLLVEMFVCCILLCRSDVNLRFCPSFFLSAAKFALYPLRCRSAVKFVLCSLFRPCPFRSVFCLCSVVPISCQVRVSCVVLLLSCQACISSSVVSIFSQISVLCVVKSLSCQVRVLFTFRKSFPFFFFFPKRWGIVVPCTLALVLPALALHRVLHYRCHRE